MIFIYLHFYFYFPGLFFSSSHIFSGHPFIGTLSLRGFTRRRRGASGAPFPAQRGLGLCRAAGDGSQSSTQRLRR